MVEGMIYHRTTPLLKCIVLFLFIFTAKVLTSRPQESQDSGNNIQHQKPSHYVRTFTKYHHRRTIKWNNLQEVNSYWPVTQDRPKVIAKRSIENSNEHLSYEDNGSEISNFIETSSIKSTVGTLNVKSVKNVKKVLDHKNIKVKAAIVITDPPTTLGPTITCLYKLHTVGLSVTPSYHDDKNDQFVVENEISEAGIVSNKTLPTGELVQVEQCTDPKAYCYTLWHQDNDGNITVRFHRKDVCIRRLFNLEDKINLSIIWLRVDSDDHPRVYACHTNLTTEISKWTELP